MTISSVLRDFSNWESAAQPLWKQFIFYIVCAAVLVGIVSELLFFMYVFAW